MCALRFPWFILLVGFGPVCRRWGGGGDYWWFLWGLAVFVGLGDGSFLGVCVCVGGGGGGRGGLGLVGFVQGRELGACARLAFGGLSCR